MPYTPPDIQDAPSTATPLSGNNIETWLSGVATYVDTSKGTFHVEDFASEGFGWGTNDTAPWQAALDAAHAAGGTAKVSTRKRQSFTVDPLKFYSDTIIDLNGSTLTPTVRGSGLLWDAVFYTAGAIAQNGSSGDGTTIVTDSTIANGTLNTAGRSYTGVKVQNADRIRILRVRFPTIQDRIGVRLDTDTDSCVVHQCHMISTLDNPFGTIANAQGVSIASSVSDSTGGAYGSYGSATVDVTTFTTPTNLSQRHVITDNRIENGTHGVSLSGAQGCVVANNVFTDTSHRSVIVSVSSRNQISDNVASGQFSCAYLLCFGSRFNVVSGNIAYCTASVSEFNAFRASFGASDNQFTSNYAYGVTGAAFRAFTGSINNTFTGNKAEACGQGLEFRSLVTDSGYQQNVNTPAMTGNTAIGNDFLSCTVGIRLWSGTTTVAGSTPATTAGVSVPLVATLIANRVKSSATYGVLVLEDTLGTFSGNTGVNNSVGIGNAVTDSGTNDWNTPRGASHWVGVNGNTGGGLQTMHRLPPSGNAVEWRDSLDSIKAYLTAAGGFGTTNRHAIGSSVLPTVSVAYLNTISVGNIGYRIDGQAAQTADLMQFTKGASPSTTVAPVTRVDKNGAFITAVHAAPADVDLAAGEMAVWFDQTNGAARMMVKAKQADGTVRTGQMLLA